MCRILENIMFRAFGKAALISFLCVSFARPLRAETIDTAGKQLYAGIGVVSAAVVVGIIFFVRHEKHKTLTLTGCVSSGNLTDDRDKQVYTLSGDAGGIKAGDRMTLSGKPHGNMFEVHSVIKDLGACQP